MMNQHLGSIVYEGAAVVSGIHSYYDFVTPIAEKVALKLRSIIARRNKPYAVLVIRNNIQFEKTMIRFKIYVLWHCKFIYNKAKSNYELQLTLFISTSLCLE